LIAMLVPRTGVGNKLPVVLTAAPDSVHCLVANLSSFALDYVARQKVGGTHLNFFIVEQLPVLSPDVYSGTAPWASSLTLSEWMRPRVLELTFTAWDLGGFARDLGWGGAPFRWDHDRRALLRAELDSAFFLLYGVERHDVGYIMETFPIVRRNDESAHGEYRTKRLILEIYDAMAKAIETGEPYETILDPPPADGHVAHLLDDGATQGDH